MLPKGRYLPLEQEVVNSAARVRDGHGAQVCGLVVVDHAENHPEDDSHLGARPEGVSNVKPQPDGVTCTGKGSEFQLLVADLLQHLPKLRTC